MTVERIIQLLQAQDQCLRNQIQAKCQHNCPMCELVQDMHELVEMYSQVIEIMQSYIDDQPRNVDFYVRDKASGRIHRIGTDRHDSIWVDTSGNVFFQNLQSGEGCGPFSHHNSQDSYEFVPSDCGEIQEEDSHGSSDDL